MLMGRGGGVQCSLKRAFRLKDVRSLQLRLTCPYVVRETSVEIGLNAGNVKRDTQNEE